MTIVRVDKKTGDVRPSNRQEVERIVWLNYQYPNEAMQLFNAGDRIHSPFAYYEIRHDGNADAPVRSSSAKEAA